MIPALIVVAIVAMVTGRWAQPRAPLHVQWQSGLAFVTRELFLFTCAGLVWLAVWWLV